MASLEAFATCLCTVFLAAAALRLLKVAFVGKARRRPLRRGDDRLPIYTIICALYREANVVNRLVAAIRALDYPGIMAQTPLD
jgi:cellulose synthase/poly-beta-1,6-N-acetylglucosamine synthase-like glycosyltransferase